MRGSLIQRECILFISIIGKEKMPIVEREKTTISYADVTASLIVAKEVLTPNLGASKSKVEIGNVRSLLDPKIEKCWIQTGTEINFKSRISPACS